MRIKITTKCFQNITRSFFHFKIKHMVLQYKQELQNMNQEKPLLYHVFQLKFGQVYSAVQVHVHVYVHVHLHFHIHNYDDAHVHVHIQFHIHIHVGIHVIPHVPVHVLYMYRNIYLLRCFVPYMFRCLCLCLCTAHVRRCRYTVRYQTMYMLT
jgi:hypothetical protein